MQTTEPPPKELRTLLHKLITLGKKPHLPSPPNPPKTLPNLQILNQHQTTQTPLQKLFPQIPQPYTQPQPPYTPILKVGPPPPHPPQSLVIQLLH
ncbi:L17 family ribosomal protein [Staphylococcus haemolyticus]|uniref:L17 family ribosomal protein n=1 Tax=Staphylococcus haemolyticus TaxID=1283 RepID=UPI00374EA11B